SAVSTTTVNILSTPQASYTSTAPKCTGLAVDFTNTGTTSGVNYSWDFGTGSTPATSTTQNPNGVIYSTSGIKTVTLTVTNSTTGCAVTSTNTINIYQTPTSNFSSNAPVCENTAVNFTNNSSTGIGVSYSWDFGIGATPATATSQNPTNILYSLSGNKTVTLTVTNEFQCSAVSTTTVNILSTPQASYTSTAPKCTGLAVDFTNTGTTSGVNYSWDFGTGSTPATSTTQNPTGVIYSTSGIKTVTLTVTNSTTGCVVTSNNTININLTPSVSFTSTAPQCVESGVNFTNTGSTGENWTYLWDFGQDGLPQTANAENPTGISYNGGGYKIVTLTISDGVCMHIDTNTIFINSLPIANASKDTTICADRSVQIGTTPDSSYTYNWFPSSTLNFSNIANPVSSPIANITNYVVTVQDTLTGCYNTDSVIVTMLLPLNANAGVDVEICRNENIQVGAALVEGQSYVWSPAAGLNNINSPNPVVTPDSTTTYLLTVSGSGCEPVTDEVTVIVHQLPKIDAGLNDSITHGSSTQLISTGGVQYEWTPSNGLSNTGIYNPIASPDITTTYNVVGIDIYGCKNNDSVTIYVITPSVWVPSAFTPDNNGKNDVYYVRGEGINNFEFAIFNSWGETVFYSKNISYGWDGRKQGSNELLPEGAYAYYIKGILTNGESVNLSGIVNLIR
ncbi:MAG: PKD domain-containing protein, partial [Bacteroidia bacterium]|nr:PKD domain-containing protein [Bacteroidia bacterium]